MLSDVAGSFRIQWFFAAANSVNQMLALALSAISLRHVTGAVDVPSPQNPLGLEHPGKAVSTMTLLYRSAVQPVLPAVPSELIAIAGAWVCPEWR